jgi:small-conductance mechanosensitive channel
MDWITDSPWFPSLVAALIAVAVALVVHRIGRSLLLRLLLFSPLLSRVARQCDAPMRGVLPLLALQAVWQGAPDDLAWIERVRHWNGVLLIAALTWLAIGALRGLADGVIAKHPVNMDDNLEARRIHTQTRVLSRTAMGVALVAGVAFMLMTFPGARQLGASLLASAGVVGLVAGIAAKSVFSNLIAGLQIALSQPIRIDDVLVVQGEWGRVEEITGTYVVLAIWDQRRLIIPLQWFIENPFQNWTRDSAQILGTVLLWVDYTLPLAPLREEAERVCRSLTEWDGRLCKLEVTDASERCMQLRVLVSSASSDRNWDLRCKLREALIDFVRREHPQALPRLRAQVELEASA